MTIPARGPAHAAGPLRHLVVACGVASVLTGCYTVDQERFATSVRTLLPQGVTAGEAVRRLRADGFDCDGPPTAPTCAKTRQRLLPSTCIERVDLAVVPGTDALESVVVKPIVCAGF